FDRETTAALMEAMAGLSGQAKLEHPGACPVCGCLPTRWLDNFTALHGGLLPPTPVFLTHTRVYVGRGRCLF
ncbi:MAG: hypothetical protein FWD61_14115, partial [Phycisphaerales bacterium]|nr:hypothetical protein [Phycisphaerales bacterium]